MPPGVGHTQSEDEPRQRLILKAGPGHALHEPIEPAECRNLRLQVAAKIHCRLDPNAAVPDRTGHDVDPKRFASANKPDMLACVLANHDAPAMCAAKQGKFWPAHDRIYETQAQWAPLPDAGSFFAAQIATLRLDREQMLGCLERGETLPLIRKDAEGATRSGARSTPSFYIEGGMMSGVQPLSVFRRVLDSIHTAKSRR